MRRTMDKSWTLFLDRDGVINRRPMNDYVKSWEEFAFLPGVLDALEMLSQRFGRIIVVTNQQGVGKQVMTEEDLQQIHRLMIRYIERAGGRIDAVYYCADLETHAGNCRKPGIRMAEAARRDFPEVAFERSIMAGDTLADLQFGMNAGMTTVYINTNQVGLDKSFYSDEFPDLISFAKKLAAND